MHGDYDSTHGLPNRLLRNQLQVYCGRECVTVQFMAQFGRTCTHTRSQECDMRDDAGRT